MTLFQLYEGSHTAGHEMGSITLPFCPHKGTILQLRYKGDFMVYEIVIEDHENENHYKLIVERHFY
jgi:hypothetical protein